MINEVIVDVTWVLDNIISCLADITTSISPVDNPPATPLTQRKKRTQPTRNTRPPKRLRS